MEFTTRPARPDDLASIAVWSRETFEWGDYIEDRFDTWLEDKTGAVIVCVDANDVPLAVANARMLSPTEGWLEGARVHPDFQRTGMGTAMNQAGVSWARGRGARVVRLATESDNEAANRQVEKLGYRLGSEWATGFIDPDPTFRAAWGQALQVARTIEVDGAWVFWSTSDLAVAGRGLLNNGWQWRVTSVGDLETAAASGCLLQSRHGWVIQRDFADQFETRWIAAEPDGLPGLLEGLLDRAAGSGHDHLVVKLPALDWARESLRRAGFRTKLINVYYLPI